MNYNVGDKFYCKVDFNGAYGDICFKKGKTYELIENWRDGIYLFRSEPHKLSTNNTTLTQLITEDSIDIIFNTKRESRKEKLMKLDGFQ